LNILNSKLEEEVYFEAKLATLPLAKDEAPNNTFHHGYFLVYIVKVIANAMLV